MNDASTILSDLKKIEAHKKHNANWFDRVVTKLNNKKKHDQALVHPCVIDGKQTLVFKRGLGSEDPAAYRLIQQFAITRGYQLKEDQRSDFIEGIKRVKNYHCANVISVLVLTTSLLTQNAQADSVNDDYEVSSKVEMDMTNSHIEAGFDFDVDSYKNENELIVGLISWINNHSSFNFDLEKLPKIKKVSANKIAQVAFGGELPAAIDAESLRIYGLYNFNEETIYLLDSLDLDTKEGKGILLHELVHFLQYQTGLDNTVKCKNELESLAYVLEAKFLEAQHHHHKITQHHINRVSQCAS
jgi:hypothetical protein